MSAPPPPPLPERADGQVGLDADALASAQSQLMQLIPLFEETKQFLKKVQTDDKSTPRLEVEAFKRGERSAARRMQHGGGGGGGDGDELAE